IELVIASRARPAAALEISADSAIASISSDLFTLNPFAFRLKMFSVGLFFLGRSRLSHKRSENSILRFSYSFRLSTGVWNRYILRGSPWYWLLHGETVIPMGSPACQQLISGLMRIYALCTVAFIIAGLTCPLLRRRYGRARLGCISQRNI